MEVHFLVQGTDGSRTKRLRVDEIASIERGANSIGLAGAELVLLDRTRLFLPNTILGIPWKQTLEALAAHVNQSSSKPSVSLPSTARSPRKPGASARRNKDCRGATPARSDRATLI